MGDVFLFESCVGDVGGVSLPSSEGVCVVMGGCWSRWCWLALGATRGV